MAATRARGPPRGPAIPRQPEKHGKILGGILLMNAKHAKRSQETAQAQPMEGRRWHRGIVLEGEEYQERWTDLSGPLPCVVRHPDAGGRCGQDAVMEIYGLCFCSIHGAECKSGALEEAYFDAAQFFERLDNSHVVSPASVILGALRETTSALTREEGRQTRLDAEEELMRAFPVIPGRVHPSTLDYDCKDPECEENPVDLWYQGRMLVHRLMRVAHEDGRGHWAVEVLEELREHHAAQMAFALAIFRRHEGIEA